MDLIYYLVMLVVLAVARENMLGHWFLERSVRARMGLKAQIHKIKMR